MSKKPNNNLEDFFRNSLKNYSENPSNDLWDKIEGNIPPKPSKRLKPAYFLLALLLLLMLGFGYEYFHFKNQMLTVNETVTFQKQELSDLKNQLEVVKSQLQSASQSTKDIKASTENDLKKATQPDAPKDNNLNRSSKKHNEFSPAATLVLDAEDKVATSNSESAEINQKDISVQNEIQTEQTDLLVEQIKSIDFITTKPCVAEYFDDKELVLLGLPKENNKSFSLEIYTSALRTFPNKSQKTGDQKNSNNWDLSMDFGALFNLGLSKNWDIQIGVGYNKMVLNDAVSTELLYSRDELNSANGTYTSFYSYMVNTPSGELLVNSSLSNQRINDGRDLEIGDPFSLDLQYRDEIHYFQLPVFVRYKMGSGKYRFTMKGGIIQKFLLDEKIKLSSVNPDFERLENDFSHISNEQTSASTTSMDLLFGAGAEYRLSSKNSIHLQSTFSYSLQEIYPGIKPFSVGLQLGLQHQLGR